MACERYLNAIHELVDGTLGPLRRTELELHLETCEDCAALVADLQELARASAALGPMEPPARVWRRIADRLQAEGRVQPASRVYRRRYDTVLALAAALLLVVGGSLFLILRDAGTSAPGAPPAPADTAHAEPPAGNAAPVDPVQAVTLELARSEQHFQNVVELVAKGDRPVDAETAAVLQKSMLAINDAIAESRKAIETNPQNAAAQQTFYEMLKQKIQFLQDTIALMNEMRTGDAAGAAQIVEGGKS
jgi:anti-sigma factor RsiW